jgi:4'-phosphopantetheinyl transferase
VYTIELDQPDAAVERLCTVLAPRERDASTATQVARAAARRILGETLGCDAAAVPISRRCARCGHPTHGRPVVTDGAPISFSVSHSGGLGLVAVIEGNTPVGVDVESVRARARLDALARRVLDAEDHAAWARLPGEDARLRAFLQAWTEKEAYLKGRGIGIATRLRAVPRRPAGWTVTSLEVPVGFVAALAVERADVEIERHAFVNAVMPNDGTAR